MNESLLKHCAYTYESIVATPAFAELPRGNEDTPDLLKARGRRWP